jgi:hypothetical protein
MLFSSLYYLDVYGPTSLVKTSKCESSFQGQTLQLFHDQLRKKKSFLITWTPGYTGYGKSDESSVAAEDC